MIDMSDCISGFANSSIKVERARASEVIEGIIQDRAFKTFSVDISLQPMTQKDLNLLPEGMLKSNAIKGYTSTELFTVDTSESKVPDRINYNGVGYIVTRVDTWAEVANYYKVIAVRTGQ